MKTFKLKYLKGSKFSFSLTGDLFACLLSLVSFLLSTGGDVSVLRKLLCNTALCFLRHYSLQSIIAEGEGIPLLGILKLVNFPSSSEWPCTQALMGSSN